MMVDTTTSTEAQLNPANVLFEPAVYQSSNIDEAMGDDQSVSTIVGGEHGTSNIVSNYDRDIDPSLFSAH